MSGNPAGTGKARFGQQKQVFGLIERQFRWVCIGFGLDWTRPLARVGIG